MNTLSTDLSVEEISGLHPILKWYGRFHSQGATLTGQSLVLPTSMASRFAIGIEKDGIPVLGVQKADLDAIGAIRWSASAIVYNHRDKDWVLLSCNDISKDKSGFTFNLFIPIATEHATVLAEYRPARLRIRAIRKAKKNGITLAIGSPRAELDLHHKGLKA